MSALPPPPPPPPPTPLPPDALPEPLPIPPSLLKQSVGADPSPFEAPPTLTFNVAAASPPAPTSEPAESPLHSPVVGAASDRQGSSVPVPVPVRVPVPVPAVTPAAALTPAPAPKLPTATPLPSSPPPPAPKEATFQSIAAAPVRARPPAPAPAPAVPAPPPLSADDETDYLAPDDDADDDRHASSPANRLQPSTSATPEADTVIAVAAPMRRAQAAQPSSRFLGLLVIVLLALWIVRLGAAPLFDVDEGAFAEATRELVVGHDWGSTTLNGVDRFDKPILVYWLQAASMGIFGVTEFAARLPSALCAFGWCLALGRFAWRRFGPPVAIAAAGILATSLGPMLIGRAATADSLLNLLLTLSTLDLWRHLETGRDAPRRRAFAWIGLGLLAKGPVALLIPFAAAGLWLLFGRDRSRLMRLISDAKAWLLLVGIAAPWYAYATWRHGMAFVDGFLLHHNLDRFTGSLEGHRGSLFYYLELLPIEMMPWAPLLVPIAWHLRTRWKEPLGRFLLLWLGFVLAFFSLSGTKLPHYVLYGFTPLMLLAAQELVVVRRPVRFALFVTILLCVVAGAASPWIARTAAAGTHDALYQTLLSTAPAAPWVWLAVPIGVLVFALTLWIPSVRNYLTDAQGAIFAAGLSTAWLIVAVMPWWGRTLQDPIRSLARTLPIAQLNLQDNQRLVQWKLHQPSIAYYLRKTVERADPTGSDWALTRVDRLTPADLARFEIVQQERGYALIRPASAASEPLARIGAGRAAPGTATPGAAPPPATP